MKFITFSYKDDDNGKSVLYVNEELLLSININKQGITIEFDEGIGAYNFEYSPETEKAILKHMSDQEGLLILNGNMISDENWKEEIQNILNKDEKS